MKRQAINLSFFMLCVILGACQSNITDLTKQVDSKGVALPSAIYGDPAWLEHEKVAFSVRPPFDSTRFQTKITVYDLRKEKEFEILPPTTPKECSRGILHGPMSRLPDNSLGVVYTCITKLLNEKETLLRLSQNLSNFSVLQEYPSPFTIGIYSFSQDMKEFIQENAVGTGLDNQIYRVKSNTFQRLLPNFQRAKSPTLSLEGSGIAFFGTEKPPNGKIQEWSQIEGLARSPWDLYLMDENGANAKIILPKINDSGVVKWSPHENFLAFSGQYEGGNGLWVFSPISKKLFKLWDGRVSFDWSPDGAQILLVEYKGEYPNQISDLVIIDVPWYLIKK